MKKEMIDLIQEEIKFLENCITETNYGSWSTHLNKPMRERIQELRMRIISRSLKEKHTQTFEEFMTNFCKYEVNLDRYILVDDKGEMMAVGFSKKEQKLIEKYPEAFKKWSYKNN